MTPPLPIPHSETGSYLRNRAAPRAFFAMSICDAWRPDWLAGAAGFELLHLG